MDGWHNIFLITCVTLLSALIGGCGDGNESRRNKQIKCSKELENDFERVNAALRRPVTTKEQGEKTAKDCEDFVNKYLSENGCLVSFQEKTKYDADLSRLDCKSYRLKADVEVL